MPGSPWENGYCESFNSKRRDELLDGEIFYTLKEAQIVIEGWRQHYNPVSKRPSVDVVEANRGWIPLDPAGFGDEPEGLR
jgi:transposase InsO family protein